MDDEGRDEEADDDVGAAVRDEVAVDMDGFVVLRRVTVEAFEARAA